MSTIITSCPATGRTKIMIDAANSRTRIYSASFENMIILVDGEAETQFIRDVCFRKCTINAENLRAFGCCIFEDCEMDIVNLPTTTQGSAMVSINSNLITSYDKEESKSEITG